MATIGFNIYEYGKASKLLKLMLAEPELYTDFSYLTYWAKIFQRCAGVAIFIGFVKVFKYLSFNSTMSILAGTLQKVILYHFSHKVGSLDVLFTFFISCSYGSLHVENVY